MIKSIKLTTPVVYMIFLLILPKWNNQMLYVSSNFLNELRLHVGLSKL